MTHQFDPRFYRPPVRASWPSAKKLARRKLLTALALIGGVAALLLLAAVFLQLLAAGEYAASGRNIADLWSADLLRNWYLCAPFMLFVVFFFARGVREQAIEWFVALDRSIDATAFRWIDRIFNR